MKYLKSFKIYENTSPPFTNILLSDKWDRLKTYLDDTSIDSEEILDQLNEIIENIDDDGNWVAREVGTSYRIWSNSYKPFNFKKNELIQLYDYAKEYLNTEKERLENFKKMRTEKEEMSKLGQQFNKQTTNYGTSVYWSKLDDRFEIYFPDNPVEKQILIFDDQKRAVEFFNLVKELENKNIPKEKIYDMIYKLT